MLANWIKNSVEGINVQKGGSCVTSLFYQFCFLVVRRAERKMEGASETSRDRVRLRVLGCNVCSLFRWKELSWRHKQPSPSFIFLAHRQKRSQIHAQIELGLLFKPFFYFQSLWIHAGN